MSFRHVKVGKNVIASVQGLSQGFDLNISVGEYPVQFPSVSVGSTLIPSSVWDSIELGVSAVRGRCVEV